MIQDDTSPICPLPGQGACPRGGCGFWDAGQQECACDSSETSDPLDATSKLDLEAPCVIQFCEDYD